MLCRSRLIAVTELIFPAASQQRSDVRQYPLALEPNDLCEIVLVHKTLDRFDRRKDRSSTKQRWKRSRKESSDSPERQQTTPLLYGQDGTDALKMPTLGCEMLDCEAAHTGLARDREDAPVDPDRAGLARLIAAKLRRKPLWDHRVGMRL